MQKIVPRCLVRIFHNKLSRSTPLDPNLMFGAFLSVWVHLRPFCYYTKLDTKCAKLVQLMQKFCHDVLLEFFATNTPDPQHYTLKSCFGAFLSVWVHLELFCYYTKLEAKHDKLAQLMQQFVPRCFAWIFRNKCSRSTPLDPKLMVLCVSLRLCAFGSILLQHDTCCKTSQTGAINAKVRVAMSC